MHEVLLDALDVTVYSGPLDSSGLFGCFDPNGDPNNLNRLGCWRSKDVRLKLVDSAVAI